MDDNEFPLSDEEFDLVTNEICKPSMPSQSTAKGNELKKFAAKSKSAPKVSSPADEFPDPDDEFDIIGATPSVPSGAENPKKRSFDALVRDATNVVQNSHDTPKFSSDNFDNYDEFASSKGKRPRWDQPAEVIKALRRQSNKKRKPYEEDEDFAAINGLPERSRESVSVKIPSWNFVALTRHRDSQRVYVRLRPKWPLASEPKKTSSGLLNSNYNQLKEEAEKILIEKIKKESLPITEVTRRSRDTKLWVDKYRPNSYMELLSDESVNRTFLHWMKLWDKVVFGRELRQRTRAPVVRKFGKQEEPELVDKRGFPIHRIALLSGPPGLGKTTLAHVVAKQVGYNVIEINASDDRGPEAFRQALLSSTQMKSLMGADPRPNCLILDEIDGAPAASIELLLKFVQGKLGKGKKSKEGAKDSEYCKRPVICICNEAYTPSLRSLRQMAYVINVPKVSAANLADRLQTICRREGIDVDLGTLIQLAEKSGCDIRTCLGTLQYMGKDYGKVDVNVGVKDTKKTIFEAWREILQIPMKTAGPLTVQQRVQRILHVVHSESSERLAQGVFENYPQNCSDAIQRVSIGLEWFQYYDEIKTVINARQEWTVAPYVNYAFVSWHLGFATMTNPKLSYPYAAGEVHQKLTKSMAILAASRKIKGQDTETIVLDIAPFLFELLNPKLRSVATNLYSTREKVELRRLIDVMLDIGVSFVQEKSEDGAVDYQIEPNLYEIGMFPNCKLRRGLSYAAKQIVAQELELERLARAAITTGVSASTEGSKEREKVASKAEFIPSTNAFRPNHLNEVERIVTPKANKYRNFFENFTKKPEENVDVDNAGTSPKLTKVGKRYRNLIAKYGVWFKYREGFSNSIRRNVSLEDLM